MYIHIVATPHENRPPDRTHFASVSTSGALRDRVIQYGLSFRAAAVGQDWLQHRSVGLIEVLPTASGAMLSPCAVFHFQDCTPTGISLGIAAVLWDAANDRFQDGSGTELTTVLQARRHRFSSASITAAGENRIASDCYWPEAIGALLTIICVILSIAKIRKRLRITRPDFKQEG